MSHAQSTFALADDVLAQLIAIRRDLHAHPQLSYEETYASAVVQRWLGEWNIPFEAGIAETGVVGWLLPENEQVASLPAIALRADMDALAMEEATGLPYTSQNTGCMHACGHDGHTTILLGAAQWLAAHREQLRRPVKLIFQPAEEVGGGGGRMVDEGVLTPAVGGMAAQAVVGIHNWPGIALGQAAVGSGPVMAGTDRLVITLKGEGGHAAMPYLTSDLNVAAAAVVQALQSIVSRRLSPTDAAVVSICRVEGGKAHNVLPARVELEGTVRYFTDAVRQAIHEHLGRIAQGMGMAYGCEIKVEIEAGYPSTVNDPVVATWAEHAAENVGLTVLPEHPPSTAAEDFAFFSREIPAVYVRLGVDEPDRPRRNLHTDQYDFNDALLAPAIRLLTQVALSEPTL